MERSVLVFVNSREECEAVTTTLRQYCEAKSETDRFLIHHGNLSASYRETAESAMKDEEQHQTAVTTATLELGIDIGRLERAFQINAPFMVSSFLQRMGRTGAARSAAGDVVRDARGAAGGEGDAAGRDSVGARAGHRSGSALYRGALGGTAKARPAAVQLALSSDDEHAGLVRRDDPGGAGLPRAVAQRVPPG